jgi:4-hydroxy-tetrahydrodipicolinate reductase
MIKIGLIGYGKAGRAVARVMHQDPQYQLCWVATRTGQPTVIELGDSLIPVIALNEATLGAWLDAHPIDALVDFSDASSMHAYAAQVSERKLALVTAVSAYDDAQLDCLRALGERTRVLCSPNITVGINFLILAARLLREIAPFADIEILEQHFRDKPEISGTAKKIAESLVVSDDKITSMRLGGIVGHHEIIFGFPNQTVRLIHDSIRREAFGTGAAFALGELLQCEPGYYAFEDLLMKRMRTQLLALPG